MVTSRSARDSGQDWAHAVAGVTHAATSQDATTAARLNWGLRQAIFFILKTGP